MKLVYSCNFVVALFVFALSSQSIAGYEESARAATDKILGRVRLPGVLTGFDADKFYQPDFVISKAQDINTVYKALQEQKSLKPGLPLKRLVISKMTPDLMYQKIKDTGIELLENVAGNAICLPMRNDLASGRVGEETTWRARHLCVQEMRKVHAMLSGEASWAPWSCIKQDAAMISLERYYTSAQALLGETFKPEKSGPEAITKYYAGQDEKRAYLPPLTHVNYCSD